MVWMPINAGPRYSNDRGVSWTASTGAPASQIAGIYTNGNSTSTSGQPLAADRANGSFYIGKFGGSSHVIYRSTDNGATWTQIATVSNGGSFNLRTPQLVAAPVSPTCPSGGDIWLCDDGTYNGSGGGLWRSINSGVTWSSVAGVSKVTNVSFGESASGSGYSVYINGLKGGVSGIYTSDDYGVTWVQVANPTIEGVSMLAGDRQNHGSIFIGTGGRGVFSLGAPSAGLVDGGLYEFESVVAPGKSLNVYQSGTAAGTNVQIWTDSGGTNARWTAQLQADGHFELVPNNAPAMHLNVDLSGGGGTGSNVQIYNTNNENSHWVPELESDGNYEVIPQHNTALRLNVAGGVNADGTNVTVSNNNGNARAALEIDQEELGAINPRVPR